MESWPGQIKGKQHIVYHSKTTGKPKKRETKIGKTSRSGGKDKVTQKGAMTRRTADFATEKINLDTFGMLSSRY